MDFKEEGCYKWIFTEKGLKDVVGSERKVYKESFRDRSDKGVLFISLRGFGIVNSRFLIPYLDSYNLSEPKAKETIKDQDKRFELVRSIIQGFCSNPNHEIFIYEEDPDGFEGEDPKINDFIIDKSIEIADKILEKLNK